MNQSAIDLAANLVRLYQDSTTGDDFAATLRSDPAWFVTAEETSFYWDLIDAAFYAGQQEEQVKVGNAP